MVTEVLSLPRILKMNEQEKEDFERQLLYYLFTFPIAITMFSIVGIVCAKVIVGWFNLLF